MTTENVQKNPEEKTPKKTPFFQKLSIKSRVYWCGINRILWRIFRLANPFKNGRANLAFAC